MENNKKYFLGFVLVLVLFFIYRYVSNPLVVTVTGTGKMTVPATSARMTATVLETGEDLAKVEGAMKAKLVAVRLLLVTNGVSEKSLLQTQMQVTPLSAVVSGGKGYSAQVSISFQTADLQNIDSLLVKLYGSGAALVTQPVIEAENITKSEEQVLKMALDDANKNLKMLSNMKRKFFKKTVSIQQASSGNVATAIKQVDGASAGALNIEVAKAVSVVYQLW